MVTEIFLISDSDITLTESSWKTWPNFLPPSFVKIVTEDMMLYDDSYSRARSIHFTQKQNTVTQALCSLSATVISCVTFRLHWILGPNIRTVNLGTIPH
jgi:hypothetical protein